MLKQWELVVLFCQPSAGTMTETVGQRDAVVLRRKEESILNCEEASNFLAQGSQVTINNTPVLDLLALYPETLPDLMKPSKGTRRRPGSDEHLLAAMHKTLTGLGELRVALSLHPQLAGSSVTRANPPLVPYHGTVQTWVSKHGSPYDGTPPGI